MRLNLILPKVEPGEFEIPKKCQRKGCSGKRFIPRQEVRKKIVDAEHREVIANLISLVWLLWKPTLRCNIRLWRETPEFEVIGAVSKVLLE
jgi:hypothetical protein